MTERPAGLREHQIVEAQLDVVEGTRLRSGIVWGAVTSLLWIAVDAVLEPAAWRLGVAVRVALSLLVLWPVRRLARTRVHLAGALGILCFGLIAPLVAVADHYALYVLGFSMIVWASGIILRWPWRAALIAYLGLCFEFVLAHLVWRGPSSLPTVFGAGFYLATAALLMVVQAAQTRQIDFRSLLLALRLEERNQALIAANEELRIMQGRLVETEKTSALGRLLAGLSHEINNPINVIINNVRPLRLGTESIAAVIEGLRQRAKIAPLDDGELAQRLTDGRFAELSQDVGEALDDVAQSAARIQGIHRDLRAFVRSDVRELAPADLTPGLQATLKMIQRSASPGIEWRSRFAAMPDVLAHPGQVNQIFFNLLQNAADAVGAAGVVEVSAAISDAAVAITVADSGPGVAAEVEAKIFEPFFTTKAVGQGTGLGLAVSRELAERNGGSLELVRGGAGGGARFVVTLPRPPSAKRPLVAGDGLT